MARARERLPREAGGEDVAVPRPAPMTAAHDQMMTLHIRQHVEAHEPREDDPHYLLFDRAKARMKRQGLWVCVISDELCGGQVELHHSMIEFSEIGSTDHDKVAKALGLHFDDDEAFAEWCQSPGNLEPLCVNHHRSRYGVHVLPEPLWQAVRFHRSGTPTPAEFIAAKDLPQAQPPPANPKPTRRKEDPMNDIWTYAPETQYAPGASLTGYKVEATDGKVGKVDEATDDVGAAYVVVNCKGWFQGSVLLPAGTITRIDHAGQAVHVGRTKSEIKAAPEYTEGMGQDPTYRTSLGTYYGADAL